MVIILNYLHWVILAVGGFMMYRAYKTKSENKRLKAIGIIAAVTVVSLLLFQALTAGYIPKQRSSSVGIPNPPFEQKDLKVENRLRAPTHQGEESEKRFADKVQWREAKPLETDAESE